jgi:thiamine biosynthesis lipoprotein
MIDAGGDAALRGEGPDGAGWLVDVEDPADARRVVKTLRIRDRAVATSAPNRRRWRTGAGAAHHLIDPRTGAPASSELAQVTVVAPDAEQADVLAKVAFVLGADEGARWLGRRPGIGGVLVLRDGSSLVVGELEVAHA